MVLDNLCHSPVNHSSLCETPQQWIEVETICEALANTDIDSYYGRFHGHSICGGLWCDINTMRTYWELEKAHNPFLTDTRSSVQ